MIQACCEQSVQAVKSTTSKRFSGTRCMRSEGNCFRDGSNYSLCYEVLYAMGRDKAVSRRALIDRICKLSGLDERNVSYNLGIVLSPSVEGTFHRSARNADYYVDKLENGMVRLMFRS